MQALEFEHAIEVARDSIEAVRSSWRRVDDLMDAVQLPRKFRTFGAYVWAHQTLISRTMYLPDDAAGCLTPFGDLFNYCPPPPPFTSMNVFSSELVSRWKEDEEDEAMGSISGGDGHFADETNCYHILARQSYKIGDEVLLCYGAHTNLELLLYYGFLMEDNSHDKVPIPLEHLTSLKPQENILIKTADSFLHQNGCPSWSLLKALRLVALDRHSPSIHRSQVENGDRSSWADDVKAMNKLKNICIDILSRCRASEEDERELHAIEKFGDELEDRRSLAIRWRANQKNTLRKCIELIERMN